MQRLGNGFGLRSSYDPALLRCQVLGFALDLVQQLDVLQSLLSQRTLIGDVQVVELATGMRHAADLDDAFTEAGLVAGVIVTHQLAFPVNQEGAGMLTRPAGGEVVYDCFQISERGGAVSPDVGFVGFVLARCQHVDRRFIRVQHAVLQYRHSQCIDQRLQLYAASAYPLGQCRARNGEAGAAEDAFLTIQRQMISVFGNQYLGQQAGGRDAFVDDLCRNRRLGQGAALVTGPLATDMAFNGEHTRYIIQLFADVFADTFELTPTAALRGLGFVMDQCPGQFGRQRRSFGLLLGFGVRRQRLCELGQFSFDGCDVAIDQLFQQQPLVPIQLFAATGELVAFKYGYFVGQLLDHRITVGKNPILAFNTLK